MKTWCRLRKTRIFSRFFSFANARGDAISPQLCTPSEHIWVTHYLAAAEASAFRAQWTDWLMFALGIAALYAPLNATRRRHWPWIFGRISTDYQSFPWKGLNSKVHRTKNTEIYLQVYFFESHCTLLWMFFITISNRAKMTIWVPWSQDPNHFWWDCDEIDHGFGLIAALIVTVCHKIL
jgi:hypothetical protein